MKQTKLERLGCEYILSAYLHLGSVVKTARFLGCSPRFIKRALDETN